MNATIAADDGRAAEAIAMLRGALDRGDDGAGLLLGHLLAKLGKVDDLRRELEAGMPGASGFLLELLTCNGDYERAHRLRTAGLRPPA